MGDVTRDFGLSLHESGRAAAVVSFSRVLLTHVGRVEEDTFCSTVNLTLESEYAVTFDFDRPAIRQLLALLPTTGAARLGAKLAAAFQEPEMIEFSTPDRSVHSGEISRTRRE